MVEMLEEREKRENWKREQRERIEIERKEKGIEMTI